MRRKILKSFKTKYGYFSKDGKEYIITTPRTPRPWINVISNGDYGITVSQTGSGYSWRTHAQLILPPWLERQRKEIETALPRLEMPRRLA